MPCPVSASPTAAQTGLRDIGARAWRPSSSVQRHVLARADPDRAALAASHRANSPPGSKSPARSARDPPSRAGQLRSAEKYDIRYALRQSNAAAFLPMSTPTTAFKSSTRGCSTCFRLNARSCRHGYRSPRGFLNLLHVMPAAARSRPLGRCSRSLWPRIIVNRLLKSCATHSARRPTASILCACRKPPLQLLLIVQGFLQVHAHAR